MKKTLTYALGMALGMIVAAPAMAQDNFPDVNENHWAYEALMNLKKEGILVGYPDGLFRGGRLASRYELAVAINAAYMRMKSMADGFQSQLDALKSMIEGAGGSGDLKALRDQIAALQNDMNSMKSWGDDIANMKKMAADFQKELASLGVDVDAMKKDLGDLEKRVSDLEKKKMPVNISGDVNFLILGGHGDGKGAAAKNGITPAWRVTGVGRGPGGTPVGMGQDLTVLHEAAFSFTGNNDEGPKWGATIVYGNTLTNFGGQNALGRAAAEGPSEFYIQNMWAGWDTSLWGFPFGMKLGRQSYKISPLILARPDTSPEYMNSRWDSGERGFDGARFDANFGPVKATLFGGRVGIAGSSAGTPLGNWGVIGSEYNVAGFGTFYTPLSGFVAGTTVPAEQGGLYNQVLGLHLNIPFGKEMGGLDAAYMFLDSNRAGFAPAGATSINRNAVFGVDANWKWNSFMLRGGFSQSNLNYNTKQRFTSNNKAYYGQIGYEQTNWGITGGYKKVEAFFTAPGSWDRLGTVWNPTGIQGAYASAWIEPAAGFWLKGKVQLMEGTGGPVRTGDKARSFIVGAGYKLNTSWEIMGSYEDVEFKSALGGLKPLEKWFTVGLGYTMGSNSMLHFMYQASDLKNIGGFGLPGAGGTSRKGGLFVTQLSVKF